jgi:hypothetical protein
MVRCFRQVRSTCWRVQDTYGTGTPSGKGVLNSVNMPRYQCRMQVGRVGTGGRFRFTAESKLETPRKARRVQPTSPRPDGIAVDYGGESRLGNYNFLMYTDQLAMSAPLGQVLITIDDKETSPIYYIPPISANTPSFSVVNSLYVYCDVVGHERVGDSCAQLMDIVPVQGAPCQRTHYVFDPPAYLPVNRNFIDVIRIIIHDGSEGEVLFPDDVQNVVCRLHFRRASTRIRTEL